MCKRSWRVDDVEALPYILDKAFRLAEAGRPGPVLVDVPMDMFSREMDEELRAHSLQEILTAPRYDSFSFARKLINYIKINEEVRL